jgi:hypothetical protein
MGLPGPRRPINMHIIGNYGRARPLSAMQLASGHYALAPPKVR